MIMALMVGGIVALLAGVLSILLPRSVAACTGLILLGLSAVLAELKLIARRLAADSRTAAADVRVRAALPQGVPAQPPMNPAGESRLAGSAALT